ncbi:uncharacterized protein RCC_09840 [Ramularia collo-cygni]|uniref:Uncharacterized protein n=1 Tax=Ramularia collo-cygni TaxID=112498 RepID=A0A2D3V7Z7_9PEZI|nr:uncharacterized protein RCC_09840 [Ramularia collo-cygni]CZT24123.1 uncharacterized protein RCC_09840 [Ramularia collo-cygni]
MDIMDRVRALPNELQDEIFQYTLLAELPSGEVRMQRRSSPTTIVKTSHTSPVPRPKTTLSCLVSYMNEIIRANQDLGLEYAQAALCIARLFAMYNLFKHIPGDFFRVHSPWRWNYNGVLEAAGAERLYWLAQHCQKVKYCHDSLRALCCCCDRSRRFICYACYEWLGEKIEDYGAVGLETVPDFILRWCRPSAFIPDESLDWNDDDWIFEEQDGKVKVLAIWQKGYVPYTWLSRDGGPWVLTRTAATIKAYDEDGRGGIMEWNLDDGRYELGFSNIRSNDYSIDAYLCSFDKAGISNANQARNDADYTKEQETERLRGAKVAAMSKKDRAKRTAREGRYWVLA